MPNIIIDKEFLALLPALDKDTYALLEENLLQNGCRDSLVLWGNILIDGHNRYEICKKHNIEFNTINKDFASREEALIWIISTQVSRRNLSPIQLSHFRGLHYMADKKMQGGDKKSKGQKDLLVHDNIGSTAARLAERYRVSPKTINRDAKAAAAIEAIGEVSETAKKMILSGEVAIDRISLRELSGYKRKEIEAVAETIENGTYEKPLSEPASSVGPSRPIDTILAAMSSIDLAVEGLSESFSVLPKIRSGAEKTELKARLRSFIEQLETLDGRISL